MNIKKIGEFIKEKRKEKNLTQKELAEKLYVTDRAVSKWERGINCPDISLLKDLSSILEISVNELLSGEEIKKLELAQTDQVLLNSVNTYTSIEKKKRIKLWILTIFVIIIDMLFILLLYLTYNQIIGSNKGITINSIQNKYVTNKFLLLTENKNYPQLTNKLGSIFYETGCQMTSTQYDYVCQLKELNDQGVEFISHKNLNHYFDMVNDIAEYELKLKYENKEQKIKVGISSIRGNNIKMYFMGFILSDSLICNNIDNSLSWCYKMDQGKNYYLYELDINREDYFPKEINEKIINLFSLSNYN